MQSAAVNDRPTPGGVTANAMKDLSVASPAPAVPQQSHGRISASNFRTLTSKLRSSGQKRGTAGTLKAEPPELSAGPAAGIDQTEPELAAIAPERDPEPAAVPGNPALTPPADVPMSASAAAPAGTPLWETRSFTVEGVPPVPAPPKFKLPDFAPVRFKPQNASPPPAPVAEVIPPTEAAPPAGEPVVAAEEAVLSSVDDPEAAVPSADAAVMEFEALEPVQPSVPFDSLPVQDDTAWPDLQTAAVEGPAIAIEALEVPETLTLGGETGIAEPVEASAIPELETWAEPQTIANLARQVQDIPSAPLSPPEELPVPEAAPPPRGVSVQAAFASEAAPAVQIHKAAVPAVAPAPSVSKSDRLFDAMIKTIADSVYAKPTAAERAAFLRDIAALMEEEGSGSAETAAAPPKTAAVDRAAPAAIPEIATPPATAPTILRKDSGPDPFAKTFASIAEPKPLETADADEESGDLALSLLDMMSAGSASGLPQERALAADTLLRILPRIPVKQLLAVVERVAIMEQPPALLVARLIRDPRPEVVAPLLERCMHITDQDLIAAAREADPAKQRMMARRRVLTPVLADELIRLGDPSVVLTLIRNPGASFSHDAFYALAEIASRHNGLLAPLATRADLPPPVAFELFWFVPPELRRFILSRFLTDSETLNKILRITLAAHGGDLDQSGAENKFPPREVLDRALEHIGQLRLDDAANLLAEHANLSVETILRILADPEGEPLAVILKALGYPRSRFSDAINGLRINEDGILRRDRDIEELQTIFDCLSFNKARILLTYWDWYVRKAGPYAPRH